MKKSVILTIVAAVFVAGAVVYLKQQKPAAPPAPITETAPTPTEPAPPEIVSTPKPASPAPVTMPPGEPTPAVAAAPVATNTVSDEETNSIRKTVDALLAAHGEKHAMFDQLRTSGQLEAVIAELQQRAAANPKDPEIPTTLGEAQLNLVRSLHEANGDIDQIGILAMQADQNFNAALKIDPKNWEAQFVKASTMFYWPPNEARDNDAVQRLASLIDQQESMPSQSPAFAQTYIMLGKQYQKIGKTKEALATWQLGAQKFPSEPAFRQLINGQ